MTENAQKAFELAAAIYRVARLCPEGEVLIDKIKQAALEILEDFVREELEQSRENIKVLQRFLALARLQKWLNEANFDILARGYRALEEITLQPSIQKRPAPVVSRPRPTLDRKEKRALNERQQQVLDFLQTKNEFQLKEIKKSFPKVSDKTLRNDLKALIKQKLLRREGQGAGSVYKVMR